MTANETADNAGKRFASGAIDYIIIFAFTFGYIMLFGEPNETGGKTVSGLPALVPVFFWFAWLILPEVIFGTTLGHSINGLKIISMEGEKPTFSQSLRRRLCDIIEITWCLGLIAFVLIKNTQFHQRLGDIWGHTLVVDKNYRPATAEFEFENRIDMQA